MGIVSKVKTFGFYIRKKGISKSNFDVASCPLLLRSVKKIPPIKMDSRSCFYNCLFLIEEFSKLTWCG